MGFRALGFFESSASAMALNQAHRHSGVLGGVFGPEVLTSVADSLPSQSLQNTFCPSPQPVRTSGHAGKCGANILQSMAPACTDPSERSMSGLKMMRVRVLQHSLTHPIP